MNEHMVELGIINHTGHCFRVGYISATPVDPRIGELNCTVAFSANFIIDLRTCVMLKSRYGVPGTAVTDNAVVQMFKNLPLRSTKELGDLITRINFLDTQKRDAELAIQTELAKLDKIKKALSIYD